MKQARIAELHRMIDERRAGLGDAVSEEDYLRLLEELLDDLDLLRTLFMGGRFGHDSAQAKEMAATFEDVF